MPVPTAPDSSLARYRAAVERAAREESAPAEVLEVRLVAPSGRVRRETAPLPSARAAEEADRLFNYCAALINNAAMTWGGVAVECWCSDPSLVAPALRRLDERYPQVRQVLSEYHRREVEIRHVPNRADLTDDAEDGRDADAPRAFEDGRGIAVGVNIGQTMTKLAAVRDGEARGQERMAVPTWGDGGEKSFATLLERLTQALAGFMSRHALEGRVGVVGIAIGGIVNEGYVTSRSGIAERMSDGDFEQLRNLAATLQERLGAPALLTQDVIAKAHALRPRYAGRRVLVLDLGTSTGGAFIAADGAVPDYLNQVGRVVVDLSEHAIPRDDLKARGVLSKYLSLTGYARACRTLGLEDISTDSAARLAAANDPKGLRLLETLSQVLAEAVVVLNRYYDADTAVLTGGLMGGEFGSLLVGAAGRRASEMGETLPELEVSTDPVFEGADGAARMAASRLFSRAAPSS